MLFHGQRVLTARNLATKKPAASADVTPDMNCAQKMNSMSPQENDVAVRLVNGRS
jgi:hypothetical protein